MPSIEAYLEQAPDLLQSVLNQWGHSYRAQIPLTDEFKGVLDPAFAYFDAKGQREQYERLGAIERLNGIFDAEIASTRADEDSKRRAFAQAYKIADEKRRPLVH